MKTSKRPSPVHSGRADHVAGEAAAQTVGTGTDTQPSSDWLAEREQTPPGVGGQPAQPAQGVPLTTRRRGDHQRGKAVESKRGRR
jgi:hypothetical protein